MSAQAAPAYQQVQVEATDNRQGPRSDAPPPPPADAYGAHPSEHPMMADDEHPHYTMAEVASERAQQPFKMQVPQARPAANQQQAHPATHAAPSPLANRAPSAMGHFVMPQGHQDDQNGAVAWNSSGTWIGSDEAVSCCISGTLEREAYRPIFLPQQAPGKHQLKLGKSTRY